MPRANRLAALAAAATLAAVFAHSAAAQKHAPAAAAATPAQQALAAYLARVRQVEQADTTTTGSLWSPNSRFNDLSADFKAHSVNDLITINILEATSATGTGSLQSKRSFNANSGFSGLFGPLATTSRLQSLFSPSSASDLEGQAATASTSNFQTSLTGRVADVLPNGFLVVEAVRTITMNGQQQTVIVHGVVRPADVAPDNSVLSTQVGELEIDLEGKGIISDTDRQLAPWWKILMKFLSF